MHQMQLNSRAILLLTTPLGKSHDIDRPLSVKEWAEFKGWLNERGLQPSSLLKDAPNETLRDWKDQKAITFPRLEKLLDRSKALESALEKWRHVELWVLTQYDPEYPDRLEQRLKSEPPPVLFGCGDKKLLEKRGIAVVGSRNATEKDIAYTKILGAKAAAQRHSIVSGGARGVDQSAMLGALGCKGTAVGVLADSLLRSATSAKYRKYLRDGCLALVSPFNPEARFNIGNAMARNRYIYCLADAAVVISSTANKGGTWKGAREALKKKNKWGVPVWVKKSREENSGNPELIRSGARYLPEDCSNLSDLFHPTTGTETDSDCPPLPFPKD